METVKHAEQVETALTSSSPSLLIPKCFGISGCSQFYMEKKNLKIGADKKKTLCLDLDARY